MEFTKETVTITKISEVENLNVSIGYNDFGYGEISLYTERDGYGYHEQTLYASEIETLYNLIGIMRDKGIEFDDLYEMVEEMEEVSPW